MVLDTLVLKQVYTGETISADYELLDTQTKSSGMTYKTDTSYEDDNVKINLKEYRQNDTTIYVADIQIVDIAYLKTAFAKGTFGKNITAKTTEMATEVNAILAINGDYYGVQENGYVLKNGVLYRQTATKNRQDLVIYKDGSFGIINEEQISATDLLDNGAYNILSFGPGLVDNGEIIVSTNTEVAKAMANNPRTAIGKIDDLHYVFVVSDGRTNESKGLSLYELAGFMKNLGVETAYNLDGGGSSAMYFNGNLVNKPTTNGNRITERSVSDIVYIGY
ncbi:MAG: phosphodiester glycosidase family protein [Clostridia bacterium]|nr:phosphodiester glycosidase family protein [Clostridia bacterium]